MATDIRQLAPRATTHRSYQRSTVDRSGRYQVLDNRGVSAVAHKTFAAVVQPISRVLSSASRIWLRAVLLMVRSQQRFDQSGVANPSHSRQSLLPIPVRNVR